MWKEKQWAYNFSCYDVGKVQISWVMVPSIKYMDITSNLLLISHNNVLTQITQMVHCCLHNCEQTLWSDIKSLLNCSFLSKQ